MICKYKITGIFLFLVFFFGISTHGFSQNPFQDKHHESKFVFQSIVGFSTGVGNVHFGSRSTRNATPAFRVHQILAYQFNPYFFMGIGGGVDIWNKTAFIPLYLNLSVTMIDKTIAPHWYFNGGYSFKWYGSQKPEGMERVIHGAATGIYGETGIGIKLSQLQKVSFILTFNYTLQQSRIKYSEVGPNETDFSHYVTNRSEVALYHFAGLKLGILY
ncbi:MAG: hypothetical protein LBR51_00155 [Bacteroidales bacterium]|jgi:hypothetical protein|nr:hypothetical protein [Bacteroidales bacterium]